MSDDIASGQSRFNFPAQPGPAPMTPIEYVKDKTVWEYRLLTRNLSKEEAPSDEELNTLGKEGVGARGTCIVLVSKQRPQYQFLISATDISQASVAAMMKWCWAEFARAAVNDSTIALQHEDAEVFQQILNDLMERIASKGETLKKTS